MSVRVLWALGGGRGERREVSVRNGMWARRRRLDTGPVLVGARGQPGRRWRMRGVGRVVDVAGGGEWLGVMVGLGRRVRGGHFEDVGDVLGSVWIVKEEF